MPNRPEKTELSRHSGPPEGISVIMVSYWTGLVLSAAIDSVLAPNQDGVDELIVVDNGNPPAVSEELIRLAEGEPRLKIVSGHGNVGFARGCNIGARRARGSLPVVVEPGLLSQSLAQYLPYWLKQKYWAMIGCSVAACSTPTGAISEDQGGPCSLRIPPWLKHSGLTGWRPGCCAATG